MDFTDELWSVLCRATSYAQLTDSLRNILDTIAAEELRPFVYTRNKTEVARLVQALVRGEGPAPDLSGSRPLELAIECGLEKLRRDYSHTIITGELATREAVLGFLEEAGDREGSVLLLARLHRLVQVAGLAATALSLPPDCMRAVVQAALARLQTEDVSSFSFPLPPAVVAEQLMGLRPASWQVGRQGQIDFRKPSGTLFEKAEEVSW